MAKMPIQNLVLFPNIQWSINSYNKSVTNRSDLTETRDEETNHVNVDDASTEEMNAAVDPASLENNDAM